MTSSPSTFPEQAPPSFLREELFELVDEWCQQLFGTEDKPEAAAYELARLTAEHAAIEALYAIRIRMGDHTYRYQEDDGSLTYKQAEDYAFEGLALLQQYEMRVEREACCSLLNKEGWQGLGDRIRAERAIAEVVKEKPREPPSPRIKTGSVWQQIGQENRGLFVVIYGGYRVIGRSPEGKTFRSSVGTFLRQFEPVDPESVFAKNEVYQVLPQVVV
jgi:hypothetical protein